MEIITEKKRNADYPDRHRVIHKVHCDGCPSSFGMDEESKDISFYPKELIAREFLFVCYKRQSRLCKGLCDKMGIDQDYLDKMYADD